MGFIPENFLMAEAALDQIATEATAHIRLVDSAIANLNAVVARFAEMPGVWAASGAFIDEQVVANPGDKEWLSLQTRKDKLTADFLAMRTTATAVKDAATAAR